MFLFFIFIFFFMFMVFMLCIMLMFFIFIFIFLFVRTFLFFIPIYLYQQIHSLTHTHTHIYIYIYIYIYIKILNYITNAPTCFSTSAPSCIYLWYNVCCWSNVAVAAYAIKSLINFNYANVTTMRSVLNLYWVAGLTTFWYFHWFSCLYLYPRKVGVKLRCLSTRSAWSCQRGNIFPFLSEALRHDDMWD